MLRLVKPPIDKIIGINNLFKLDNRLNKINLVIGAYKDSNGHNYIFNSVKDAIKKNHRDNFEYLPIQGDNEFLTLTKKICFNNNETHYDNIQTLSGTGALKIAGDFLAQTFNTHNSDPVIYLPDPTWANHNNIFTSSGLCVSSYAYLNKNRKFTTEYIYDQICKIPNNNIILLHACAHNPTGYDPHYHGWYEILNLCKYKNLFPVIDMAYLGFASGNIKKDNQVLEILNKLHIPSMICCSFAKNFGLYSERVGTLLFCGNNDTETSIMKQILSTIIRRSYSTPPANGSHIIKTILNDAELTNMWKNELLHINNHYKYIRLMLQTKLENALNDDFSDIIFQKGMFYYSSLNIEEVYKMRNHSIYMPDDGRISLAGINEQNIDHIVRTWMQIKM